MAVNLPLARRPRGVEVRLEISLAGLGGRPRHAAAVASATPRAGAVGDAVQGLCVAGTRGGVGSERTEELRWDRRLRIENGEFRIPS